MQFNQKGCSRQDSAIDEGEPLDPEPPDTDSELMEIVGDDIEIPEEEAIEREFKDIIEEKEYLSAEKPYDIYGSQKNEITGDIPDPKDLVLDDPIDFIDSREDNSKIYSFSEKHDSVMYEIICERASMPKIKNFVLGKRRKRIV